MATEKVRRQIASAAARLLYDRQEDEYLRAKQRAARQLGHGWVKLADLPTNREVRGELQAWASLREGEGDRDRLSAMRTAALLLMRQLRAFRPRLLGDALRGQLSENSRVEIQLVSDNIAEILSRLRSDHAVTQLENEHFTERDLSFWRIRFVLEPERLPVELSVQDVFQSRRRTSKAVQRIDRAGISDVEALLRRNEVDADHLDVPPAVPHGPTDRFALYASLLYPLEQVKQSPKWHPEGDALYHSLQVFELARQHIPYDEEFLTAALLHDVGKGIDRLEHVEAGIEALEGSITPRTAWLIEHHAEGQALRAGTLGVRSRRRLAAHPDYEELMLLVQCDREGRRRGAQVPDVEEALDYLRELAASCES